MRKREQESLYKQLLRRKEEIINNITSTNKEIKQLQQSEVNDEMDMASVSLDQMIDSAITTQQNKELHEILIAINKIESNKYGECEMCGDKISLDRLKIKPHAKYCIQCRGIYEESGEGRARA